jgi:antitoxin HigA-1
MPKRKLPAIHPGEHLKDELDELGLSARAFARLLDIPVNRVTQILNGQRGISADTALRLARYFGTSAEFWMNLQQMFELRRAEQESGREIAARIRPRAA